MIVNFCVCVLCAMFGWSGIYITKVKTWAKSAIIIILASVLGIGLGNFLGLTIVGENISEVIQGPVFFRITSIGILTGLAFVYFLFTKYVIATKNALIKEEQLRRLNSEKKAAETKLKKEQIYLNWIKTNVGDSVRIIPVTEVIYFMARDKYIIAKSVNDEFLIRKSIKSLVEELDPSLFWQIHRGTIVNVNQIDKISRTFSGNLVIHLKCITETLPISRAYRHLFKQM